jgi:hypothetical protein
MDAALQDTIVLLASMVVGVLVAQTILMFVFVIAFRKWCNRTEALVDQVSQKIDPILSASRDVLSDTRQKLASVTDNLNEITLLAKGQIVRIDALVRDTTDRAQLQVVRLDQLVGDTMNRVEETTRVIQYGVLKPVQELAAVIAGVRAGLTYFVNRNRRTVERATQDEEMFI